jgi:hypothetical protein
MFKLSEVRIPFKVRMAEGIFKGEAIGLGDRLQPDCIFEIRLSNGEIFWLKAERDYEVSRYNWTARATQNFNRLFPALGKIIERYFAGASVAAQS